MAAIHDLLAQIADEALRDRIEQEVNKLTKTKKFGLVFEQHLPECTPLYDMPIKTGVNIMLRNTKEDKSLYVVLKVDGETAICGKKDNLQDQVEFLVKDIVRVAEFGEPIYPYLKPIDSVCNDSSSDLWHTLIESDNYHALQLLEYLYAGKVDCIYIDPPYNTGAKDWKYNNDYVDGSDSYRHSKWLSFMERRLRLAKKLLDPRASVLIVTIDEKEYLHLGCLLEELFPEANIQMISTLTARSGAARFNSFSRTNEFIFFVMIGNYMITPIEAAGYSQEGESIHWRSFRRGNPANIRTSRPSQFYPLYINTKTNRIEKVGKPITPDVNRFTVEQIEGCVAVFPVRDDGTEMLWSLTPPACEKLVQKGYIKATKYTPDKPQLYVVQYLSSGTINDIESGKVTVKGYSDDGGIVAENLESRMAMPKTQWSYETHDARDYGTKILKNVIGETRFDFPKSLYAVRDSLKLFVANKKNALIVDFFAGSGTTLHAVNLLNMEDGGQRRCILVTNNEVSEHEAERLREDGYEPGTNQWDALGIAQYVTWPRTKCSIMGVDVNGKTIPGEYIISDDNRIPMSDGFKSNAAFFKLGFLDKTAVALGLQFNEMLPTLWLKSGAFGPCPKLDDTEIPSMLILPENKFAVLIDENAFANFSQELSEYAEIQTVFLVTDYEVNYQSMVKNLGISNCYQLYRDYLDNFRINHGRS